MSAALSKSLYSCHSSWLLLILHILCSTTGPYMSPNFKLLVPQILFSIFQRSYSRSSLSFSFQFPLEIFF
jgi:hypothetical protein